MSHESNQSAGDELLLTAVCYVGGDLSAEEAAAFEARLATDQSAREAVAEAVELVAAVAATELPDPRVTPAAATTHWRSAPFTWMALGAAACLAVVGVWRLMHEQRGVAESDAAVDPRLAIAWSETRDAWQDPAADEALLAEEQLGLDDPAALESAPPDWMVAAVSGMKQQQSTLPGEDPAVAGDQDAVPN